MIRILACLVLLTGIGFGQDAKDLIPSYLKFTPDSVIQREASVIDPRRSSQTASGRINGVAYRFYYSDGSGTFEGTQGNGVDYRRSMAENWSVGCKKDAIDDSKFCYMQIFDLWIWRFGPERYMVSIGAKHYPGSGIALRIDQHPASTAKESGFTGPEALALIEKLKTAKSVTTRFQEWPNGYNTDQTFALYGFAETFQYVNWAYDQIR